jgi:two-component system, NarL family, nitrate/nitrite response regulator NarL
MFREAVSKLLEAEEEFRVVGEARTADEALELVTALGPDVLLLDNSMPPESGMGVLRNLAALSICTQTILLATSIDKSEMLQALLLGARGVIPKQSTSGMLFKSIRAVMAGEFWVSRDTISVLVETLRSHSEDDNSGSKSLGLTRRELDIIAAVVKGQVNKDIAQTFHISEYTVKHHLTRIFDKLGVSNRVKLAIFAVQNGLLKPNEVIQQASMKG